jgi:hypothetical protein
MQRLQINIPTIAIVFDVDERTVYKWRERKDKPIPHYAAMLVTLLLQKKLTLPDLLGAYATA